MDYWKIFLKHIKLMNNNSFKHITGIPTTAPTPVITEEPPVITEEPPVITEEPPAITEEPPVITEEPPVITEEPPVITEEPPVITEEPPVESKCFVKSKSDSLLFLFRILHSLCLEIKS